MIIYKITQKDNKVKKKFLCGLFKIKEFPLCKKYYFLGIQFFKKNRTINYNNRLNELRNNIYFNTSMMFAVAKLHSSVFPRYKNIHDNATAVLIATGPTLLHYKKINKYIHIAVNNAYKYIEPDYWFAIDGQNIAAGYAELMLTKFIKFYGQCITPYPLHYYRSNDKNTVYHIPDCVIDNSINAHKFYFDHPSLRINRDIESQPLPDLGSCVFSALYFAIYAGIKKIYIVGCDCACNGYFNGAKQKQEWVNGSVTAKLLKGWNIFKEHVEIFHPDVELISVNPVGLRGMFRDVYTQSYLDANPELVQKLGDNIEILDESLALV